MKTLKFHFVGIGGISMSALAYYLKNCGYMVQGSDIHQSLITQKLKKNGIKVFSKHCGNNVKNANIVVYNYAIDNKNPELVYAKNNNIKVISRGELLGYISRKFKNIISIAGSHGKTSTTEMIYNCFYASGKAPTLHIGGIVKDNDFGIIKGSDEFFITEACEYHDSFLFLKSNIGVILNVEPEHLDYYKTFENEKTSYKKFMENSKHCVVQSDIKSYNKNCLSFGTNGDIVAKNITTKNGKYSYDCYFLGKFYAHIDLGSYGKHNIVNSLAVIGVCILSNIPPKFVKIGLCKPLNIKRRFEIIKNNSSFIVHDYAHHPSEIKKTIETFISCTSKKRLVVFQPHTFSRTKTLFSEFLQCFDLCDEIFIVKTYPAREKYDKNASGYALYKALKSNGKKCSYFASFDIALKRILYKCRQDYDVLILGAGDIENLAYKLK